MKDKKYNKERLEYVREHLGEGAGEAVLREYTSKFNVGWRQYYVDRKAVLAIVREQMANSVDDWLDDFKQRYEKIYTDSIMKGDRKTALSALDSYTRLLNIGQKDPGTNITVNFGFNYGTDDE